MTKIKLCGLSRPEDIQAANRLRPDYIGFVFFPKSHRYVSPDRARALRKLLAPGIAAVGVFVREDPRVIAGLLEEGVIDLAQLHGGESREEVLALRALTDKPILQAIRVDSRLDAEEANRSPADYILLDAGTGGTGTCFDWSHLKAVTRPYFLAGGLTPENAEEAVAALRPWGVDVSSGIETGGVKDPDKMNAFVTAVHRGDERIRASR